MTTTNNTAGISPANWGRLANRAYEDLFLPDALAEPKVNEAMAAYHAAVAAHRAARDEAGTTISEAEADRLDKENLANLLEKGKATDATPNRDKFLAERAAHERKMDALALIVNRREADLRRAIDGHRQDLIAAHRANADKLAGEVLDGLDALADKCNALGLELRKAEFSEAFPDRWRGRPKTWKQGLIVDRPRGGDLVFSDSLFTTIRQAINRAVGGPDPEPTTGPLHITADVTGANLLADQAA